MGVSHRYTVNADRNCTANSSSICHCNSIRECDSANRSADITKSSVRIVRYDRSCVGRRALDFPSQKKLNEHRQRIALAVKFLPDTRNPQPILQDRLDFIPVPRLAVDAQDRFCAAETDEHPAAVFEAELETIHSHEFGYFQAA